MAKAGHSLQATTILKALYGLVESKIQRCLTSPLGIYGGNTLLGSKFQL